MCFYDRELAGLLRDSSWQTSRRAIRVDFERWRRRGPWARIQELVAALLQEQT